MEHIERYRGSLLGLVIGDAVGTTLEFKSPGTFATIEDMVGGGPFQLAPGQWTDDTSMALCLAESLIERRGFDPVDQLERYLRWYREGHLSSTGWCFDIGNTVRAALLRFEKTRQPYCGSTDPYSAGNGSIMRLAPVALFYALRPREAIESSGESSRTTHGAATCVDACRYLGALLVGAINGVSKDELLSARYSPIPGYWAEHPLVPEIDDIAAGSFKRREPPEIKGTGYVVKSLEAALWAFYHSNSFRDGCLLAVNLGDDADTTGAVYGQLAGAFYGEQGIPESWLAKLAHRHLIQSFAERLFTVGRTQGPFPRFEGRDVNLREGDLTKPGEERRKHPTYVPQAKRFESPPVSQERAVTMPRVGITPHWVRQVDGQLKQASQQGFEFTSGLREFFELPEEEIEIPAPPPAPTKPSTSPISLLLPAGLTLVGLSVMIAVGASQGGSQTLLLSMAISLPVMLGSSLVSFINYSSQKRTYRREVEEREEKYKALLQRKRQYLERLRDKTWAALCKNDPDPPECLGLVGRRDPGRLWARASDDEDFLTLRLGLGQRPFQVTVKPPEQQSPLDSDPLVQEAQDVAAGFAVVPKVPISLSLCQAGVAGLAGPRQMVLNAARSLALQIATHHSPHDVKIVAIYPAREAGDWEWLRWLPHVWSDDRNHRFLAHERDAAHALLTSFHERLNRRRLQPGQDKDNVALVFFLADPRLVGGEPILPLLLKQGPALGAFPVLLADQVAGLPRQCQGLAKVEPGQPTLIERVPDYSVLSYAPDQVSVGEANRFSRTMAPIRLKRQYAAEEIPIPTTVPLLEVLGVEQVEDLDVLNQWKVNDPCDSMAVPVGKRAGGEIQYLDLHERRGDPDIRSGHGPNALVAGTVGSGKSELLQSLVASLAVHFHPHEVAFVLLDFKPPGMAEALKSLPHVVNAIDLNDLDLVPRALKSLEAELKRRGQLFTKVGVGHIDDYMERYRKHDKQAKEPLPYLVLIVDEFRRLRDKLPETLKRFVEVATIGRAFGFRMILATQKPAGVVSQQIDSNTELRLCLRVAKAEDSQEMIKRADAAFLTGAGRVYMRVGEDAVFEIFQSAWSGAPYVPGGYVVSDPNEIVEVALDGSRHPLCLSPKPMAVQEAGTQLKAVVSHIREEARRAGIRRLQGPWLEPLPEHLALEDVRPVGGWDGKTWQPTDRWLCPVIGLQDDPANQRQPLLQSDLGRRGHLFICSGPGSDNRTMLRTLVVSLARDHSPAELHLYCLDFGSFGLQVFENLPHVGAVIHRDEPQRVRRLFRWLLAELESRKRWLARHGVGSLAESRAQEDGGDTPAALVLIVDNLAALREDLDTMDVLAQLALEGRAVGIHLILAGDQTAAGLFKVLENVALRIALQIGDAADYKMIVGGYPEELFLPEDVPGRGLYNGLSPLECQVALPIAGKVGADQEAELETLVGDMRQAWVAKGHKPPMPIGVLPLQVSLRDLLQPSSTDRRPVPSLSVPLRVPIGLDDLTLDPISVDLAADGPHFLITGPPQSGKTTALTTWLLALAETFPEEMVQFILLDTFKGSLAVLKDLPHVRHYAMLEEEQVSVLKDLRAVLQTRRIEKQVGARPALIVVADDYEFLTYESVKNSLKEHAQQDHPFGFHIILAGETAQMQGYDPFRKQVSAYGSGLIVGSNDLIGDFGIFGLSIPSGKAKQVLSPGRGYLLRHKQYRLVQVATPGDKAAVQEWVRRIAARKK